MELSPKAFRDVQFREKLRGGYHPEDVDEFLEQAAVAVEAVQAQLRQAIERAERAERSAGEYSVTDETLRKMLVLAQRTADQAVGEAREEADRLLTDARSRADSTLAEAEHQSRTAYEQGMAQSREGLARADEALRQAQQEVDGLRNWVEVHRSHLVAVLKDAQSLVENAGLLSDPPTSRGLPPDIAAQLNSAPESEPAAPHSLEVDFGAPPGASATSEDATGEWSAQYMGAVSAGGSDDVARQSGDVPNGRERLGGFAGAQGPATAAAGSSDAAGSSASTSAFDERALDTFFSDQDLDEPRGLGRFRRRQ